MADAQKSGFIDTKIPLTWLITTVGGLIFSLCAIAVQFNAQANALNSKLDVVLQSSAEMKTQLRDRDIKYESVRDTIYTIQRSADSHELRIVALERSAKQVVR